MTVCRTLTEAEIDLSLFRAFDRRQEVTKCWRKVDGAWVLRDDLFLDDWSSEDYRFLVRCLKHTAATGGLVCGAFVDGALKGFVSVEPEPIGSRGQYLDLSSIHVSRDARGRGIGRELFSRAVAYAREKGAPALYISAHSAQESQAFYKAMGCVEAREYQQEHVQKEPFDCQLECPV